MTLLKSVFDRPPRCQHLSILNDSSGRNRSNCRKRDSDYVRTVYLVSDEELTDKFS